MDDGLCQLVVQLPDCFIAVFLLTDAGRLISCRTLTIKTVGSPDPVFVLRHAASSGGLLYVDHYLIDLGLCGLSQKALTTSNWHSTICVTAYLIRM